jgi:hypothetical protein
MVTPKYLPPLLSRSSMVLASKLGSKRFRDDCDGLDQAVHVISHHFDGKKAGILDQ